MDQILREIVRELLRAADRTGQGKLFTAAALVNIVADDLEAQDEKKASPEAGQEPCGRTQEETKYQQQLAREL